MAEQVFLIEFENVPGAEANRLANELRGEILDAAPEVQVDQRSGDRGTQDFGTVLALVLAAPAVIEVAKGIAAWLARRNVSSLRVKTEKGEIVLDGVSSRDAATIADRLRSKL